MPYISKTPKPPYYAVVFTSINANVDHTEHVEMYARLVQRASTYEGYLGIERRFRGPSPMSTEASCAVRIGLGLPATSTGTGDEA